MGPRLRVFEVVLSLSAVVCGIPGPRDVGVGRTCDESERKNRCCDDHGCATSGFSHCVSSSSGIRGGSLWTQVCGVMQGLGSETVPHKCAGLSVACFCNFGMLKRPLQAPRREAGGLQRSDPGTAEPGPGQGLEGRVSAKFLRENVRDMTICSSHSTAKPAKRLHKPSE